MIKKATLTVLFVFFITVVCAQTGMELFKDHVEGIIGFINSEQNKQTERGIEYQIPTKENKIVFKSKKTAVEPVKTVDTFVSQKYDFSSQTAYGKFDVLVITTSNSSFTITFDSQYPIQQYQLKDTVTKNTSKEESLNDKLTYTITVAKPFEPKYVLILSMFKDEFLSPNIIPLYKKENIKYK